MLLAMALVTVLVAWGPGGAVAQEDRGSGWVDDSGWADEPEEQGVPARGRGDVEFYVDSVSLLGPEGVTVQEFFIEVAYDQLTFKEKEDGLEAVLRFELQLTSTDSGAKAKDERVLRLRTGTPQEAARRDLGAVIVSRFSVRPGLYTYEVKVTDLQARRWQLVDLFRGVRKHGKAAGYVEVKDLSEGLQVADVLLAREVKPLAEASPFSRGELGIVPNPSHNYGLYQPNLLAYVEVYSPWADERQRYTLNYSIVAAEDSAVVMEKSQVVETSSESWAQVTGFELGEVPAGSYALRVEVLHDSGAVASQTPIEVLWDTVSWDKPEADLIQEMSFALSDAELRSFAAMTRGEREIFLREFWRRLDETPETARNEVREEFERRVAYANAHFSETEKGIYTDRGRIYIQYGEPDEVRRQVMPVGESSLEWVLEDESLGGNIEADAGRRMRGGSDERAYEIWIYDLRGRELFPSLRGSPKGQVGMKFIFVDEDGYGNYRLLVRTDD